MTEAFEGWAILELMGHRRLAGMVREVEMFGSKMCRIDVPAAAGDATQYYGGASIYCLTPTTEETARRVALTMEPAPVRRWGLPERSTEPSPALVDEDDDDDDDGHNDIRF